MTTKKQQTWEQEIEKEVERALEPLVSSRKGDYDKAKKDILALLAQQRKDLLDLVEREVIGGNVNGKNPCWKHIDYEDGCLRCHRIDGDIRKIKSKLHKIYKYGK